MSETEMRKIRLGVIGVGNMGSEYCRMLAAGKCPEILLAAAADLRESQRQWARANLPENTAVFASGSELIASGLCDAVMVCVPHFGHEALTVEALNHGLHVLCEKPAAVTAQSARKMADAAAASGKTLAYMFNQRTNCIYRAIRDALDSGDFGAVKRMSWIITDWYRTQRYYDSGSWRATWSGEGGGVLLNQCPHQLDLLIWLCGMPESVLAVCHEGKWHHIEVEDDVSVYLEFPNGATGTFVASTGDLPGTNRLEIDCEQGKIVCEDGIIRCWHIDGNEREICFASDNPWYQADATMYAMKTDRKNPQHAGVLNAFAAHLLRGEPLVAGAEDGVREMMLSNAIHLSGWTGEKISLPPDEEQFISLLDRKIASSAVKHCEDVTYQTDHGGTGSLL